MAMNNFVSKIFILLLLLGTNVVYTHTFAQPEYIKTTDPESGTTLIVGKIQLNQLADVEGFENLMVNEDFPGTAAQLEQFKPLLQDVEIKAFIGTWCDDSQYYFPQIIGLLKNADYNLQSITIIGLDRDKKMMDKSDPPYDVKYVPTVIFYKDGQELGRFVESRQSKKLIDDLIKILKK